MNKIMVITTTRGDKLALFANDIKGIGYTPTCNSMVSLETQKHSFNILFNNEESAVCAADYLINAWRAALNGKDISIGLVDADIEPNEA